MYLVLFGLNELMEVAGVEPDWRRFHRLRWFPVSSHLLPSPVIVESPFVQDVVIICGLSHQQPLKVRTGRIFIMTIVLHEYVDISVPGFLLDRLDLHSGFVQ